MESDRKFEITIFIMYYCSIALDETNFKRVLIVEL